MADPNKTPGEKLSVSPSKTLTLKPRGVEQGVVRQSFSHGRSKQVVVEKVKRRVVPGETKAEAPAPAPVTPTPATPQPPKRGPAHSGRAAPVSPTASAAPAATPAAPAPKPSG